MTKFIAYYRVSTARQGKSGLGLAAQQEMIANYVRGAHGKLVGAYKEIETGKRADRPELAKALAACRLHNATLVVAKLDRLARNVAFVSNLMESTAEFVAVDFPQANRFMLHLLAAVAEYEAKLISERTKAALAQARKRGVKLGNYASNILEIQPKGSRAGNAANAAKARRRAADLAPIIDELRAGGASSLAALAAGLNERGITTTRGNAWSPVQVSRVIQIMEETN